MQHDLRLFLFSSLCTCGGKYLSNDNLASQLLLQLTKGVWYKQLTAVSVQILSVQIFLCNAYRKYYHTPWTSVQFW